MFHVDKMDNVKGITCHVRVFTGRVKGLIMGHHRQPQLPHKVITGHVMVIGGRVITAKVKRLVVVDPTRSSSATSR